MPAPRPLIPTVARKLPKGTKRNDYEPEVLAEYDRNQRRRYKRKQRNRDRHIGKRDVTFTLDKNVREALKRLSKQAGVTKSALLAKLILEHYIATQQESEHDTDLVRQGTAGEGAAGAAG